MDFIRWADKDLLEDGDIDKFKAWYASLPEYNSLGERKTMLEKIGAKLQQISDISKLSEEKEKIQAKMVLLSSCAFIGC